MAGRARAVIVLLRQFWDWEGRAWEPASTAREPGELGLDRKLLGPSGVARLEMQKRFASSFQYATVFRLSPAELGPQPGTLAEW